MRCPSCNALNADSAAWCTQCYASLAAPEPAAPAEQAPAEQAPIDEPAWPEAEVSGVAAVPVPGAAAAEEAARGGAAVDGDPAAAVPEQIVRRGNAAFRKTSEGLDWQCALCESFNPIEVQRCTTCGHSFADTVKGPEEKVLPDVDENVAVIASAILPGTGHFLAGRVATAIGRATMYMLFLFGGWMLLREAAASGQSILPALPLLLGALVIWVGTAIDTVLVVRGEDRQLLEGRMFFWLVIVVLGLLMGAFAAAALSVAAT